MAGENVVDTGIFKPVTDDYAVISLERVFGPLVRAIADGTGIANAENTATMLGQLITLLNLAVLVFASIMLIYTIYTSILDTASDGKLMGQSTDSKYTVLRTAVGIVLLLPVKGGFTIAQVMVLYLLVWGSGLADTAWNKVAEGNIQGVSYTAPSSRIGEGVHSLSPATTRAFAEAFRVRTQGYLCSNYLNQASETLGLGANVSPVSAHRVNVLTDTSGKSVQFLWNFKDSSGSYGSSASMCGNIKMLAYEYTSPAELEQTTWQWVTGQNVVNFTNSFNSITKNSAIQAQIAALSLIDQYAKQLAQQISQSNRNESRDKELIAKGVNHAITTYMQSYQKSINSFTSQDQYSQALLQMSVKNGWIFAANWQRMMSNIYVKVKSSLESVAIGTASPSNPTAIFGMAYGGGGSETIAFFQEFKEQTNYFDSLATAFDAAATNKDVATIGQTEFENGTSIASWLADTFTGLMGRREGDNATSNIWSDPLVEIQDMGTVLLTGAAAAKTLTTAASAAPHPALQAIDNFLGPLSTVLVMLGVLLAIIIPFMPIIYYIGAVIGWVILAVEAVFAAPITVIMFFSPQRQANFIGSNHNALLTLFGVLLRPFFIVVGLICAYLLMRVGIDIINVLFTGLVSLMAPEGSISSIYLFIGTVFVYGLVVVSTVMHCCSLITGLSDYVLGWIGVGMSSLVKANPMEGTQAHLGVYNRLPTLRGSPELGGGIRQTKNDVGAFNAKNKLVAAESNRQSRLP